MLCSSQCRGEFRWLAGVHGIQPSCDLIGVGSGEQQLQGLGVQA